MGAGNDKTREIDLGHDFGDVVVKANGAQVEISADGSIHGLPAPANDTAAKGKSSPEIGDEMEKPSPPALRVLREGELPTQSANARTALLIGAVESTGEHSGEIYGGIWSKEYGGDNKPIWFSVARKLMDHYKAAAWATEQGGALPTRKQGDYLTTLKGKGGAFTEIFNRGGSFPAGFVWLAEPFTLIRDLAWCQRLRDGDQYVGNRSSELPVLCVRR